MSKNDIKTEYMQFADKLRAEVKAKGLTQAAVGEAVGAKGATVGSWCCGRSAPDDDMVRALEDLLGLNDGMLGALLPEDRRQYIVKKTAPPVQQQSKLTSENGWTAITPTRKKAAAAADTKAQPAATPPAQNARPGKKLPELMNMPWCMPAQCAHFRKVLDRYEEELISFYLDKYAKAEPETVRIKREQLFYAKQDLKQARTALADLEQQLHLLLEVRA